MIPESIVNEARRVLAVEAKSDTVGLWTVVWDIEQEAATATSGEVMRATLTAIRDVMTEEGVVAGDIVDVDDETATFVSWPMSVDDVLRRIEREWSALGRTPNPGEIVWFVARDLLPVTVSKNPMGKGWRPRGS